MSRRKPPLDDARWLPIDRAHALFVERTGDHHLAARDLTEKLASDAVRCMMRDFSTGKRERPPDKYWVESKLDWFDGLHVVPHGQPSGLILGRIVLSVQDFKFYVWEPDLKKIFANDDATTTATNQPQEKPAKSGRPAKIKWDERQEIKNRCWLNGRYVAPETLLKLTVDLQRWHMGKHGFEPNIEDLRKFVGDATAMLKLVSK